MDSTNLAAISLPTFVFNLLLALFLSLLLSLYYARLGDSLSNRSRLAPLLPFLALITLLVISVVKSSLALSLGLVGALSIVRFRTAIKDPEDLMFLFFAIGIGLGMGADQRIATVAAFLIIMGYLLSRKLINKTFQLSLSNNIYLNIALPLETTPDKVFSVVNGILGEELQTVDLRRFDTNNKELRFVYYFKTRTPETIAHIASRIQEEYTNATISIVEQNNLLGG